MTLNGVTSKIDEWKLGQGCVAMTLEVKVKCRRLNLLLMISGCANIPLRGTYVDHS